MASLSPFFLAPISPPPPPLRRTFRVQSSFPSPRPRTRRKNHLRPKFPTKPHDPSPPPAPQILQTPPLPLPAETLSAHLLVFEEEVESVEEVIHETESLDPFHNSGHRWFPNPVLDLSLRFAALLAVQTVAAVWVLGGGKTVEGRNVRVSEEEVGEGKEVRELSEFEKVVLEIREMAKEAREVEAKALDDENGVKVEVGQGLGKLRKSFPKVIMDEKGSPLKDLGGKRGGGKLNFRRRRLGFVKSNAKRKNVAKGFNGLKSREEGSNVADSSGIQQIAHQNPVKESPKPDDPRESGEVGSGLTEKFADLDDSTVSPFGNMSDVGNLHTSTQKRIVRFESGNDTSVSKMGKSMEDIQRGLTESSPSESYVQAEISSDTSGVENNSTLRESQTEQSFREDDHLSSIVSSHINGRSESGSQSKEAEGKPTVQSVSKYKHKKPWWLKLPFVLGIFLRRSSERSGPKGLYSLKMDSPSDNGGSASYTIVFQDRGDATNFCYLLESFFEDLGDFSADIVPLTIHELEEGVKSSALTVIVVRKGQLRLYAGQPLAEVETILRSLLD